MMALFGRHGRVRQMQAKVVRARRKSVPVQSLLQLFEILVRHLGRLHIAIAVSAELLVSIERIEGTHLEGDQLAAVLLFDVLVLGLELFFLLLLVVHEGLHLASQTCLLQCAETNTVSEAPGAARAEEAYLSLQVRLTLALLRILRLELDVGVPRTVLVEGLDLVLDLLESAPLHPEAQVVLEIAEDRLRVGLALVELGDLRLQLRDSLLRLGDDRVVLLEFAFALVQLGVAAAAFVADEPRQRSVRRRNQTPIRTSEGLACGSRAC